MTQHFDIVLDPTGEFQLIIFQQSISILDVGDEIGVFDTNGVVESCDPAEGCSEPANGEVLVSAGTWTGEQMEISAIMSVDLSDFGGPVLNGAVDGNAVVIKIWDISEEMEHIVQSITWSSGSGNFGDLILAASELELVPPHFDVELEETGEYQLVIFESSISILEPGDEIGIFDANGVVESTEPGEDPVYGEVLVSAGTWTGEQMEISAIMSVDLSDFGGPVLNGAVDGNAVVIKIWKASEEMEYFALAYYSAGTGTYGDILIAVSELTLDGGVNLAINEFFFRAALETSVPDYVELANFGDEDVDLTGWTLNGEALSGTISGGGFLLIAGEDPFFNSDADELYAGDNLPNSAYADISLGTSSDEIVLNDADGTEVDYVAYDDDTGWMVGSDNRGHALELLNPNIENNNFENWTSAGDDCVSDFLFGEDGSDEEISNYGSPTLENCNYDVLLAGCMDANACNYVPDATVNDGSCWYNNFGCDCADGEGAVVDVCGNCDTDPTNDCVEGCTDDTACNYDPEATDDDGSCWFSDVGCECEDGQGAVADDCGVCNGNNEDLDDCEVCFGNNEDLDDCEVCFGNNEDLDDCDECFGDSFNIDWNEDSIGEQCDCPEGEPQYWDCNGECGGPAELDCEDICEGGNICGCTDPEAWNYDPDATYDDGSCQYEIDYLTQIQPIFDENCSGYCHTGGGVYSGSLDLSSYEDLMLGTSDHGPVVIPYDSENSIIIQKLSDNPPFGNQMPQDSPPLDDYFINLIANWIDEGAIEPDDGGGGPGEGIGDECITDEGNTGFIDCSTNCIDESYLDFLGDGTCNDGTDLDNPVNFYCVEWSYDLNSDTMMADCPLGFLDFGAVDTNAQSIEIILNCDYPVSQFQFNVSGLSGLSAYGGSSGGFQITIDNTMIMGESDSLLIPAHDELLMYLTSTGLTGEDVCFSASNIVTSIGIQYQAIEGECIPFEELSGWWLGLDDYSIPEIFKLYPAFPNPFNPITTIQFELPFVSFVTIDIYDTHGRIVTHLINGYVSGGVHSVTWDAVNNSSGIYIVKLNTKDSHLTQKIVLLK